MTQKVSDVNQIHQRRAIVSITWMKRISGLVYRACGGGLELVKKGLALVILDTLQVLRFKFYFFIFNGLTMGPQ